MLQVQFASSHNILLLVIAVIFLLSGIWDIIKGSMSLLRYHRHEARLNEPARTVSWFLTALGTTTVVASVILFYSALANK